jgi:hypothetical protein
MVKRAPSRRPSDHPEKHQKSFAFGKAFWTESGSLMSVSKSIIPALPILRLPKIKKCRFDTFFGQFLTFRNWQNVVNYNIFAF